MQTIVLTQMRAPVSIRDAAFEHIPVVYTEDALRVACCGRCGRLPGSSEVRSCTLVNCGLPDRHHSRSNAA